VYAGVVSTRWEAVQLGRRLAREEHLFKHVSDKYEFRDDFLFYRFLDPNSSVTSSQFFDMDSSMNDHGAPTIAPNDEAGTELADKADAFRTYADVRSRKHRLQLYKNVFVGSEAVDSLIYAGVISSRAEAVELGQTLMKEIRLFTSVRGAVNFADDKSFYRFNDRHLKRQSVDSPNGEAKQQVDQPMMDELRTVAESFQKTVESRDRKFRFRTYQNCFVGAEAVDQMIASGLAESRIEAVQLGRALSRELDLFTNVSDDGPFCDGFAFYRFCDMDLSQNSVMSDSTRLMNASSRRRTAMSIARGSLNSLRNSISDGSRRGRSSGSLDARGSLDGGSLRSNASKPNPFPDVENNDDVSDPFRLNTTTSGQFLEIVPEAGESRSGDWDLVPDSAHRRSPPATGGLAGTTGTGGTN